MPKRRVEWYPQAVASTGRQRQTGTPVAPAQPEPIEDRPLPTNVDHTHPTRPASDDQMFNELQLKQLTDAIAAAQPEPIEDRPLSTNVDHTHPTTPAYDDQMFNELQLRQLTDAIAACMNTDPISDRTTDFGSTNDDMMQPLEVMKFDIASIFINSSTHVLSYSSELGFDVPNNIKVKISKGQYVNLTKLAHYFSDIDDETQYSLVRF